MYTKLLLSLAGAFWTCGAIGAAVWLLTRRQTSQTTTQSDAALRSHGRGTEPRSTDGGTGCTEANEPACVAAVTKSLEAPSTSRGSKRAERGSGQAQEFFGTALRFPYPCRQWAAAFHESRPPEAHDFSPVECHQLYDKGISFYTTAVCNAGTLAVSLGTRGTLIFMLAEVVRTEPQPDSQPARTLVECQFVRRLYEGAEGWASALGTSGQLDGNEGRRQKAEGRRH